MKMFVETSPLGRAVSLGWLWRHESGTYMKFTAAQNCLRKRRYPSSSNFYDDLRRVRTCHR